MSISGPPDSGFEAAAATSVADSRRSASTEASPPRAREIGTWRVAGLNPTLVKVLTVVGFAVPVVAYLALLRHYQMDALVGDQWDDVPLIRASYVHFPDWTSLWALHNGNRMLFPNLIVVALAHTVHYNIEVEQDLGAVMLLAATALFIFSHKRRSPVTPILFYCPLAFLTLSLVQWQNTLWGFQMAWYLVLLSLAATIALLDRPMLTVPTFVGAAIVAVVGSYSSTQGLLIWPVGLLLLYYRRRAKWTFVSWIAIAAVTAALYFYNFVGSGRADSPSNSLGHPWTAIKFYLYTLGDVAGVPWKNGVPPNPAVYLFGVVILVLAVLVLAKWGFRRDEHSGIPIGIALLVFGILFSLLVTEDRVIFGFKAAAQSRYTTNDLLVLAGIYLTALSGLTSSLRTTSTEDVEREKKSPHPLLAWIRDGIGRRIILWFAIAVIAVQVVSSVHYGPAGASSFKQSSQVSASITRNIDHESNATVSFGLGLFIPEPPSWFRDQAHFLRAHHLSLFG
jgi:hypothetical protein